jgi:hypothetical protein
VVLEHLLLVLPLVEAVEVCLLVLLERRCLEDLLLALQVLVVVLAAELVVVAVAEAVAEVVVVAVAEAVAEVVVVAVAEAVAEAVEVVER